MMKQIIKTFKDGKLIEVFERDLTPEELISEWKSKISATDSKLPRWGEDLIDTLDALVPIKDNLPKQLIDAINEKKSIRQEKPSEE